jgi:hypothetical protein
MTSAMECTFWAQHSVCFCTFFCGDGVGKSGFIQIRDGEKNVKLRQFYPFYSFCKLGKDCPYLV